MSNLLARVAKKLIPLCAVVVVASICVFQFSFPIDMKPLVGGHTVRTQLDSDKVEGVLLAEATLHSGRPLDPDFSYPYAIPFGPNIIIGPFVRAFGVGVLANSCGMFVFSLFLTVVCLFFFRSLGCDWLRSSAGVAIVFLSFRSRLGANLLHHILFYQLSYVCGLGIFAAMFLAERKGRIGKTSMAALVLFPLWAASNGIITAVMSTVPVVLGLCAAATCLEAGRRHVIMRSLTLVALGLVAGFAANFGAMHGITETGYIEKAGTYTFLSAENWMANAAKLPSEWVKFFFPTSPEGVRAFSVAGVEVFISLSMCVVVLAIPVYLLFRFRALEFHERALVIYSACTWSICLLQYVFMRGQINRLLFCGVFVNFTMMAVFSVRRMRVDRQPLTWGIFVPVLLAFWAVRFPCGATWKVDRALICELESRGLRNGCATYWNASCNTVLANGKVRVNPIWLTSDGSIRPRFYNCGRRWYANLVGKDKTFVILNKDEFERLAAARNNILLQLAKDRFEVQGFNVLVFSGRHMKKMLSNMVFSYNFKSTKWSKNCSAMDDGRHVRKGGVSFGPYMKVCRGTRCEVRITGRNLDKARIVVRSRKDGETVIRPEYKLRTSGKTSFSFVSEIDLERLEVVISNYSDDDIVLSTEIIDAFAPG